MTAAQSLVLSACDGAVLRLTLNRPNARNALSEALMSALMDALDKAAKDKTVRVIVLAAGGVAFCAGHDLKEMTAHRKNTDGGKAAFAKLFAQCSRLMQAIVRHPKPVIAQVQGLATAAGCQLVASCDLAIASSEAKFATPGVNIGLFCSTPMVALSRNVPRKIAMEMLLTGNMVSAENAQRYGLVNDVVSDSILESETMTFAQLIASQAYDYASEVMTMNMMDAEANEGICAFIEKRDPNWPAR